MIHLMQVGHLQDGLLTLECSPRFVLTQQPAVRLQLAVCACMEALRSFSHWQCSQPMLHVSSCHQYCSGLLAGLLVLDVVRPHEHGCLGAAAAAGHAAWHTSVHWAALKPAECKQPKETAVFVSQLPQGKGGRVCYTRARSPQHKWHRPQRWSREW